MKVEELMNDAVLNEKLQKNPELKKFYYQEQLILEVTELISKLMLKEKVSKTELAKRLDKGKSYVTQLLDGTSNMTLRTISDVFTALDSGLAVKPVPLSLEVDQSIVYVAEDETQFVVKMPSPEDLDLLKSNWIPKYHARTVA